MLDKLHLGPTKEVWNLDEGRELEISSSPRPPTQWQLKTRPAAPTIPAPQSVTLDIVDDPAPNAKTTSSQEPALNPAPDGAPKPVRPSAVFCAVGRDRGAARDLPPEVGHYDPQLAAVTRRSPSALILDRSLLAAKPRRDDRGPLDPEKPRPHVPALPFRSYPARSSMITGRNVSTLTAADQRAFYHARNGGPDGPYEVERYWDGPGKRHAPAATLAGAGRDAPLAGAPLRGTGGTRAGWRGGAGAGAGG